MLFRSAIFGITGPGAAKVIASAIPTTTAQPITLYQSQETSVNQAVASSCGRRIARRKRLWGLSERQHSGARPVRPVERDDGALVEFRFAILKGAEEC